MRSGAKAEIAAAAILLALLVSIPVLGLHKPFTETLYETNSLYQYIMVDQDTISGERYILVNTRRDVPQGGILVDDPDKLIFEYTRMSFVGLAFLDGPPDDVLFVGLGAGVMPRYLNRHYPDADIDAVEIDPEMFKIAKEYFFFEENPNLKVHILDGRIYVKRTKEKYDMIFLDAYRGEQIPFHLTTLQFLQEVKKKLKDGGVVVSNILSEANNRYFWSMIRTYREAFPNLYIYKGERSGNFIFVAQTGGERKSENALLARAGEIESGKGLDIDLERTQWEGGTGRRAKEAKVLTDDFAPVNLFKNQKLEE